ncbi:MULTISPECIES: S-methyl-5-thioribose-1-phosphate isomerase [Thermaerobacter]|uniref:Methylthioribose-1-phosphate isomerase n=1 Tax=Thermaerobacter composti TaxID=554949 RepID=A0ABZ0QN82_9FIRM|nr:MULTISPECIES: S-methyl-5-thioribose-1-phosphate isomerase [Thermaerobacter]QBS36879.1 S-methyl-5-thioribose-1-phosphate isomerase [Thermaerobacter sp. FW80]WPD18861.1 S-methyl-5-thioribose-1-phosphate isomerase [Thermaerobacter composti]
MIQPVRYEGGVLHLLDQRRLPAEERWVACSSVEEVARAIEAMVVRGAPAIGIAAAYGVALAAVRAAAGAASAGSDGPRADEPGQDGRDRQGAASSGDPGTTAGTVAEAVDAAVRRLAATRPTAVNLHWALRRMADRSRELAARGAAPRAVAAALEAEARSIQEEDLAMCLRMAEHGAALLPAGARVLTHCNTGALATGGHGTALGVIRTAWRQGRLRHVWVDETRPLLQGARLTAWELEREGIPHTLIVDGAAAAVMGAGQVDAVLVGADRIAANGDTANKIGTYMLAVLARHHGIPFYVVAPWSTVDPTLPSGDAIPIEQRGADEVRALGGVRWAPAGTAVYNPAFDVTPAALITAIVTDRGVLRPPYREAIAERAAAPAAEGTGPNRAAPPAGGS